MNKTSSFREQIQQSDAEAKRLLFLLGEELKQPLVTIAQLAEVGDGEEAIQVYAKKALRTIDNILLYQGLSSGQIRLKLEPVHVGGAAQAVAETLEPLMRAQACTTELDIQASLQTADVDRALLYGALQSMWQAVLSSLSSPARVVCRVQKIPNGVRLSVLSSQAELESLSLSAQSKFSCQPIKAMAGPSADLLTAHGMFELIGAHVNKSSGKDLKGLGVTLQMSRQLRIV